jgi:uncharacterized protein (TIGR04255 family)
MTTSPKKLKKDGIVEALFEVRFTTSAIPELYVGRLVAGIAAIEEGMVVERLPMADFPAPIRRADPNLAHQPTLQLRTRNGTRLARIGETVISWHALQSYPGWPVFQPEIDRIITLLRTSVEGLTVVRTGLRYLNFLNPKDHLVGGLKDLTLDVSIDGKVLEAPVNINYQRDSADFRATVRIATPDFIQPRPMDVALMIDIDMNTEGMNGPPIGDIPRWVEVAHTALKHEFFTLFKPEILKNLVEE